MTGLGGQGDGIAETPSGRVHVPLALPGERVRGMVSEGRMTAPEILAPAPERVAPPCPHFGACGGCALQHASDAFVAGWKAEAVRAALAREGLEAAIAGVVTSPPFSRRRAVLAARRLRRGVAVGFHARRSGLLVEPAGCTVLKPALAAILPGLAELAGLGLSRRGEAQIHATLTDAGVDLDVSGVAPLSGPGMIRAADIAREMDLARLTWLGETLAQRRPPMLRMGRATLEPPPGAFLQATAEGEAALVAAVRGIVGGARRIADLFAGCGTFALPLSEGAEIHAAEADAPALAALDRAWRGAGGLRRLTVERRDLMRRPLGPAELAGFGAVVLDPPRAGARAQVEALAAARVPAVAAVSCNPASFARDARILTGGGYRMGPVTVVDQFRWSAHVELVAGFTR